MHLKEFPDEKRAMAVQENDPRYDPRLIREYTNHARRGATTLHDNNLTRLMLCLTRGGYSKRDIFFLGLEQAWSLKNVPANIRSI